MGFSIKLAPGVRIGASSRGLRAHVGPRAARMHVGGGRTGFSSGIGPASFYTSTRGGSGKKRTSSSRAPSTGSSTRALQQAQNAAEAQQAGEALLHLLNLHQEEFERTQRPIAPQPTPVDEKAVIARHRKAALQGVSMFDRAARAQRSQAAEAVAKSEIAQLTAQNDAARFEYQAQLDEVWGYLVDNQPDTVLEFLGAAFEDNEAAAAAIGISGTEVSLAVLVPPESVIPEYMPERTDAGNLVKKKLTQRMQSDLYKILVCGYVLVTAKEAFAVAPGVTHARVLALRTSGTHANGSPRVECVMAAQFSREEFETVRWDVADAVTILNETSTELAAKFVGASKKLAALDLQNEPDIAQVLAAVDVESLVLGPDQRTLR